MRSLQRGVTLLELMIVISLVALLASMATPAISGYVERARNNRAIGEIGRISIELYRWRTNNGGAFPATLAAAGIETPPDPWGNAYTYANVATTPQADLRKDKNLNPINSDFDLYSNGADGQTTRALNGGKARDDIVRANNGAFIGLAEDY
jgi:general secretion pathway protein G